MFVMLLHCFVVFFLFPKSTCNKLNLFIDFYLEDGLLWNLPNHRPASKSNCLKNYMTAMKEKVKIIPLRSLLSLVSLPLENNSPALL